MHPGALKILKFSGGGPPEPPSAPSHTCPNLALHAKMAALPPSVVPAIDTFVPATSNLNKGPVKATHMYFRYFTAFNILTYLNL